MSRAERRAEVKACPHEGCSCNSVHWVTDYTCDGCGGTIYRDTDVGVLDQRRYAHELVIQLDMYECVNFLRQRDFCPACLDPIWQEINKLLGTDPDEERDREYD
jgi:hypothetical protein